MGKKKDRKSIMEEFAGIEKVADELRALQKETKPLWTEEDVHPDEAAFYQDALYHR